MKKKSKGFTLIELLVVISIIALLIGILLPALGQARRRAQMLQDVANLGEHGKAIGIYSAENRGRMPNIPEGNGGQTGLRGAPALIWATREQPLDDTSPDGGSPGAHNGFAISGGGLQHSDVWRMYNLAFGDYIIEGGGFELLSDIFASPRSSVGGSYDAIKAGANPDLQPFGTKFRRQQTTGVGAFQNALYSNAQQRDNGDNFTWALQGSYRYTLAGMYGQPAQQNAIGSFKNFWEPQNQTSTATAGGLPFDTQATWDPWRAYIPVSQFDFPTEKVAFWEFFAVNSRGDMYFMPNAEVAAAMVDGHAKVIKPFDVMPNQREVSDAFTTGTFWGTMSHFSGQTEHPTQGAVPGLFGDLTKPYAWFLMTMQGPRGRDLARSSAAGSTN